ncbi:hypothetical protein Tco_0970364 [Tanacetum coccineum]
MRKGASRSHRSVRSEARSRSKSKSVKSKPQSVRASRRKSSSDSGYHRWAKLPPNVWVYEGNKDSEDHLSIFSAAADLDPKSVDGFEELSNKFLEEFSEQKSAYIKGVPPVLRISAFMHGHGYPELAKKLNDKIPKKVDEMWKRVRAFIRGETATYTTEAIRSPRWEKSAGKASWSENQNGSRNRSHRKGEGRNMGTCAPDARREGYRKRPYERVEHWMDNAIAFPSVPRYQLMDCPMVVDALIEGFRVRRIHVDGGSSSEVIYEHCFRNLSYRTRSMLKESRVSLVGFSGEVSYPLGVIDLEVTIGECEKTQTIIMKFTVVKSPSPYNALLVRNGMRSLGAVASTIHSMIKFPTSNGIATIATTRETLRE